MMNSLWNIYRRLFPARRAVPATRELYLIRLFSLRLVLVVAVFTALLLLSGCAGQHQHKLSEKQADTKTADEVASDLGVKVMVMQRTAGGHMLDFRFKVLEKDKAMPLFREDIYPYLIDQKTGAPLKVTDTTKVGPMRPTSRDPRAGKVYFMFFKNPNRYIQAGQKVTVVVGDHRIKDIVVQ